MWEGWCTRRDTRRAHEGIGRDYRVVTRVFARTFPPPSPFPATEFGNGGGGAEAASVPFGRIRPQTVLPLVRLAISRRTTGATSVPSSSMARITWACGMGPTVSWIRKRWWRKSSYWKRILSMIS